ncbi:hypothetical protein [Streptomyces sp. URMC 124]|uniref:hypothetical protein n=1 Tax=Streptomyces sp. URMC 124 TaxID=3423405 RepID=UPI003F19AC1A
MTFNPFAQFVDDFKKEFGLSEATARHAIEVMLSIMVGMPGEAGQREFERVTKEALAAGEAWAQEFISKSIEKKLPEYRVTYTKALKRGVDPETALVWEHGELEPESAAEVVRILRLRKGE